LKDPYADLPKIRKAKSQSFRTRRSPSERRSPNWNLSIDNRKRGSITQSLKSPAHTPYGEKSPSPGTQSQRSSISRQGTMRASHRRKNSMSQSLNLSGRRSPSLLDRSPSGRRSPNYLTQDLAPNTLGLHDDLRRSPSLRSPTGRRSPLRLSPSKELAIQSWNERQKSPTSSTHLKSPLGFQSLGVGTQSFYLESRRSPINQLPIPPITISNASDNCGLSPKSIESGRISPLRPQSPKSASREEISEKSDKSEKIEKKERTSVMKEILAFVRKPTKKSPKQSPSKTSRFTSVFSKSSDNHETSSPIIRQSTYSSSPNTSSRAGKNAVTKQMSCEAKFSSKLKSVGSKMSLRLRRATESKSKDKKSSGDDASDSDGSHHSRSPFHHRSFVGSTSDYATSDPLFEPILFEKVVQKRHEQSIVEESPSNETDINLGASTSKSKLDKPNLYEELKRSIETLFENKEPIYENIEELKSRSQENNDEDRPPRSMQCPKLEIEPPSRRPSFDPPRSPFLENFRSLSDTDHTSLGESFEVFESSNNHYRESSFEDRHSSMDTSFDISRYHSTSYEDQTSSFEIVDSHLSESQTPHALSVLTEDVLKSSNIDLSSIEIVDSEKFQKKFPAGRKSSLETHFDYKSESGQKTTMFPIGMKAAHQALQQPSSSNMLHPRNKSPALSQQTSSNYSSRDSRDESSSFEHAAISRPSPSCALLRKYSHDNRILTDKRCASLLDSTHRRFEFPRRTSAPINTNQQQTTRHNDTSSGSEFEFPTPRRSLSASPKHTFTFRIVMKKVESSPEDLCSETRQGLRLHRERERLRRDSRRRKMKMDCESKVKSF
jgi:hypothetical protein